MSKGVMFETGLVSGARAATHAADYGWRRRGRTVTRMPEKAVILLPGPPVGLVDPWAQGPCLQCGACTASCSLFQRGILVPRRQMSLLQVGLLEELLADPGLWHCRACRECSVTCAAGADPARVLADARRIATQRLAYPASWANAVRSARRLGLVALLASLVLAALAALVGALPHGDPVRYASLFPHAAIQIVFGTASLMAALGLALGARRAWLGFTGAPRLAAAPLPTGRHAWRAVAGALRRVLAREPCHEPRLRDFAHLALVAGLVGLVLLAGIVATRLAAGAAYPLTFTHPLKIVGNACAALLIGASGYYLGRRVWRARSGEATPFFEVLLPALLLGSGLTGVAAEVWRYLQWPALAYPTYFLHLVVVLVLLISLPCSKFAHAVYRVLAALHRETHATNPQPLPVAQPVGIPVSCRSRALSVEVS